jgi:hypothetical protein
MITKYDFETGDRILIKNMFYREQDVGVCPDQLEEYKENLNCEKCDVEGSFYLLDDKSEIGLCYKCLLETYNKPNQVVKINETDEAEYYQQRQFQCYDLWCHKGHLRNMDKNSYYQDRNGQVCMYDHPYHD